VVCNHNLGQTITAVDANGDPTPNVRWLLFAFQHDGAELTLLEDLRVPVTSTKGGGIADPSFALYKNDGVGPSTGVFLYWFRDAVGEDELFFTCQLPHNWAQETTIKPHVHWVPAAAGAAGNVVNWGLEYCWADVGSVFPANTTIISNNVHYPADAALVANKHYITGLGDITATGKSISSMLVCRVFRDPLGVLNPDTYAPGGAANAGLMEIDFHYEIDSRGSVAELTKVDPELTEGVVSACFRRNDGVATSADAVTEDSIELRFQSLRRLVSASHPLKATLFFIPAVRG
jgi:hypothetical protein